MAVVVQCFHCNAVLELDDGFRGGVCRCSGCGSLLQVPKSDAAPGTARVARPAGPPAPVGGGKPVVNPASPSVDTGQSSGKLEAARAAADLGVSSAGMGEVQRTKPIAHKSKAKKADKNPPSDMTAALQEASARETRDAETRNPATDPYAGASSAAVPRAPQGGTPPWLWVLLVLATTGVVAGLIYLYVLGGK